MYHQQSQHQGSQPFLNAPRPPHQPSVSQHPNHPNMQGMGFQFPRPNQLPDELESALSIRGTRDMDHRQVDLMNQSNQHQNQGTGIGQHGNYGSNPMLLPADNQPGHQQGVDWSNYQPPAKLFASTQQQQPQSSQTGGRTLNWNPPINDSPAPQTRQPLGDGGRMEGQGLYTPESAGSILASFGLSNDDLEVLSHYPDDQLTPDTLPFILRDIQLNKSGKQTTVSSSSSSSYSHNVPPSGSSHSPEVPSLLTVTQTAGKVIDYGHASRGTEESGTRETFKREQLSSERTVKMLPAATSSSASQVDKTERRQVRLEHKEPKQHGDRDYRKTSCEKRKNSRSPAREFAPLPKSRNLDRDYRQVETKQRSSSETKSEDSSRHSLPSSSASRQHGSSKKLPTPTMISDFAAVSPKVFPHTCSLCHIQCDQEKDWIDHINTVDHTAACRDLRNKYPDWKPNLPSRSGRYGSRALWDPKDGSPFNSAPRSLSHSPSSSRGKYRREPYIPRPHGRPYSPPRHSRPLYHTEHGHWIKHPHSGSHSPPYSHRESWPDKRNRDSSGGYSHHGVKRPHEGLTKGSGDKTRSPPSSAAGHGSKHGPPKPPTKAIKAAPKPAIKTTKMAVKNLPVKKKKKVAAPTSQGMPFADRLVYLTGIPVDATEQEVTDLVSSFGKINNVILLPCSEEESEKGQGQKASVCMMKAEDAQALASASELCIRDQAISALVARKPEDGQLSEAKSKADAEKDKESAGNISGGETDQKTSDQKWNVLITGLPDSGWSEGDITELVQSFGAPSDIILAKHIGKTLVSFPDLEVAEDLVKVHSFKPAMFKNTEVKMRLVKQQIGLSTPVALYNLFTGLLDPLEGPAPVGWNSLVVIKNVPDTSAASSEVLKLMRRFGTVIKYLIVNNMIICEMATTAMALSVYKRFLMFPCIIQNNPLIFYRKADPRAHPQTKIIPAYCDASEDKRADNTQVAAEPVEQDGESQLDHCEDPPEKDGDEKTKTEEKTVEENVMEEESKDNCVEEEELNVSVFLPASDAKPDKDAVDAENTEVNKDTSESELGNVEETQAPSSDAGSASAEAAMPELPKMTQDMVNALLVECRTRTANNLNKTAAPPSGDQEQAKREKEDQEKTADLAKNTTEEKDEEAKKQEKERKEKEAKKEKERKERERREREREKERKERERRERSEKGSKDIERREWERRERERRERRRGYDERSFGSRSSYRLGGYRQSSRDERYRGQAERKKDEPEEDPSDDFPFNMSDFVTVDELGDVTDLPDPAFPMETQDEADAAPRTEQQEEHKEQLNFQDTSVETTSTQKAESDDKVPESEHVDKPTPPTLNSSESDQDPNAAEAEVHTAPSETEGQSEASEDTMKTEPDATLASSLDVEPIVTSAPAQSTSSSPAVEATAGAEEKSRRSSPVKHSEAQNEEVSNKQAEQRSQDEDNMDEAPAPETSAVNRGAAEGLPAVLQTEKPQKAEDKTDTKEKSVKKRLPPYDPSTAVGMEYLIPKTGFFCKVCSRFFTGAKVAEINHCKTLKHYENLQKFLQNPESSGVAVKTDSS
ncbi:uncharacterized protein FYW61_004838 isoform 2-T2 [Anableps anableps]